MDCYSTVDDAGMDSTNTMRVQTPPSVLPISFSPPLPESTRRPRDFMSLDTDYVIEPQAKNGLVGFTTRRT